MFSRTMVCFLELEKPFEILKICHWVPLLEQMEDCNKLQVFFLNFKYINFTLSPFATCNNSITSSIDMQFLIFHMSIRRIKKRLP
jgi:hypothetical protein